MNLYLIQHGAALSKEEAPLRPLSPDGIVAVKNVANFTKNKIDYGSCEILHSTKLRSKQTAALLAESSGLGVGICEVANLEPLDDVSQIIDQISRKRQDLMIAGHMPHLNKLASRLITGSEDSGCFEFRPGAVVALRKVPSLPGEDTASSRWGVMWMVVPQLLA